MVTLRTALQEPDVDQDGAALGEALGELHGNLDGAHSLAAPTAKVAIWQPKRG